MPLFSRHAEPAPAPVVEQPVKRSHGLFGSRREVSPAPTSSTRHSSVSSSGSGGIFHRSTDRRDVRDARDVSPPHRRSMLSRFGNHDIDPSIVQARERVMSAETAERDADRAKDIARREVQAARAEVRRLELEAKEEARLAKIKQHHAKEVSKRGSALGRHGL